MTVFKEQRRIDAVLVDNDGVGPGSVDIVGIDIEVLFGFEIGFVFPSISKTKFSSKISLTR